MKYTATFKKFNNLASGSSQHIAHDVATIESNPEFFYQAQFLVANGSLWRKTPKLTTGVVNQRTIGGKWELVKIASADSIEGYLARVGAVVADFKGGPKP
jgi:hypothetical protein